MSKVLETHEQAMELTDQAMAARRTGDKEQAKKLFQSAFQLEKRAADMAFLENASEPTLSVLHRSAATLAVDCGSYREAERLIGRALSGEPPAAIATELRTLLNQVYQSWVS